MRPSHLTAPVLSVALVAAVAARAQVTAPPDRRLALTRGDGAASEIFSATAGGSRLRRLTRNRVGDHGPAWSPDGTHIAFEREQGAESEVFVMRADGGAVRQLTRNRLGTGGQPSFDGQPGWSPDGRRIAFVSLRDGHPEIYVMDSDGRRQRRLTRTGSQVSNHAPAWSPDGRRIAFNSDRATLGNSSLYLMRPDGRGVRRLTRTPGDVHRLGDDGEAAWSPDGKRIAFISNRTGSPEVWVMSAEGGRQRRLTGTPRIDEAEPVWAPDGRAILFIAEAADRPPRILRIAPGGGARHLVLAGRAPDLRGPRQDNAASNR